MNRRKHLTEFDCRELAQSREGTYALTQPFNHRGTSSYAYNGLYPRSNTERGKKRVRCKTGDCKVVKQDTSLPRQHSTSIGPITFCAEDMDDSVSDDELMSTYMDEHPELFDKYDLPQSDPTSNRKRHFNLIGSHSSNAKIWHPDGGFAMPASSKFSEEEDDDEMASLLDMHSDPCYGLLGTSDVEELPCELLNQFPDELLQCIFGFLPISDLYLNASLVCHKWNVLIRDTLFIPWKKLYHQYVAQETHAVNHIDILLKQNGIIAEDESCILKLVTYFSTLKGSQMTDHKAVMGCLKYHHLYPVAETCVFQRLPELKETSEAVTAWAALAVIVLLSSEVGDIQRLLRLVQNPSSKLRLVDVTETFYCLTTLLSAMRDHRILINTRIHYNIFSCLHLLENGNPIWNIPHFHGSSRNHRSFTLTDEQQQIINHDIAPGQVMKIVAFAGTGKTSTLIEYAKKRPTLRFLYASFNNSIVKHAVCVFPANVTCKTFHSLAFAAIGKNYNAKKKLNSSKLTVYAVNEVLPEGQAGFVRAKLVAKTLGNFFASTDDSIENEHVPIWCVNTTGNRDLVKPEDQKFAVRMAEEIWGKMKYLGETREHAYKMTHDGYLKLWQLQQPCLSSYDAIFIDEAQDCTPSIMKVIHSQTCGKIFVGDPHQQIYKFRGAVNALSEVMHTHIFYLTQSFRFGAEIAYVGATILDVGKKVRRKLLLGVNKEGTVRGHSSNKVAILCRTNSCVFDEAVRVTEVESPSKIHIIGGSKNFGLNKIYDIWVLFHQAHSGSQRNLYISEKSIFMWKKRGGYSALKKYAISSEDKELEAKIAIVEKYKDRIPELVQRIHNCNTEDMLNADYVIGTVHKAKGLEFDTVSIADDFISIPAARHNLERLRLPLGVVEEEWNLLYVATTRAKKHLILTKNVENILTLAGEYFMTAELTSHVLKEGPVLCALDHCDNHLLSDSILSMKKQPLIYSDRTEDKGGYICHACVLRRVGPVTSLMASLELVKSMNFKEENIHLNRYAELLFAAI
ncbi:F-box DNA helicase 1 [Pelobates fuscus]|uniref:F-box DNA helicase 1 n=1 Tax=Pelobates fuscus TaxID=191477 RepID=UPI002FE4E809